MRHVSAFSVAVVFVCLSAGCPKSAPPPAAPASSSSPSSAAAASAFLAAGFAGVLDVEVEDASGARVYKISGDGTGLKLKTGDGAERLRAEAGKRGKVSYTMTGGEVFEVRDDDTDAGRFKIKSAAGATLLKVQRADRKLKIKSGDDGPELAVIKGDDTKRKLVVPPSDADVASVKRAESGKLKVKGKDDAVVATMRSPQTTSAPLLMAFDAAGVKISGPLREVLLCELLRRGL
jgi:hypothetical protein